MRRDGQTVFLGFPKRMMSTARNPLTMGSEFAREILNMYASADGAGSKRNGVVAVGDVLPGGALVTGLFGYMKAGDGHQVLAASDSGKIYLMAGDGSWTEVYSGLDVNGVFRAVTFAGRLVLVNGFDPMLAWDGTTMEIVEEFVTDTASGLTYVSGTTFTIASDIGFYAVGTKVRGTLTSGDVVAEVATVTDSGSYITVVLDASVLNNTLSAVAFAARPPVMAYIAAAHDRLWGFGRGPLSGTMASDPDRTRVYYCYGVNNHAAWHDLEGLVPNLDLADKSSRADEVMAMAVADGVTVFMLRNTVQVWTGRTPGVDGDFAWHKTMPVGCVHGGLVLALPNDVAFVTRTGVRTLSRSLQTEQLNVSDVGSELDPTLGEQIGVLLADSTAYRAANAMVCGDQNWFGLAVKDQTLVFQIASSGRGWVVFDGAFAGVRASVTAPDGELYLAKGGQVYRYDVQSYGDDGADITTRWWTPWIHPGRPGKRWANRYVELVSARGVPMELTVRRYRDLDDGDGYVATIGAQSAPDYWDSADWDSSLWDNAVPQPDVLRDHFVAEDMAWMLESQNTDGPLTLLGLKLYGMSEK